MKGGKKMSINAVDSIGASSIATKEASSRTGEVLDKDAFLRLLVTQLKYQNPINPLDNEQFISQTAAFSSLEQLQELGEGIKAMIEFQKTTNNIELLSLIGKNVAVQSVGGTFSGTVNGLNIENGTYVSIGNKDIPLSEIKKVSLIS